MNREEKEEYLKEVADELNASCYSKYKGGGAGGGEFEIWEVDDLDLDIKYCRNYCIIYYQYSNYHQHYDLCESCANIIESKIKKQFNRTLLEINIELNKIHKLLESLLKEN